MTWKRYIQSGKLAYVFAIILAFVIAGIAAFTARLVPQMLARRRSRSAGRMMAEKLRTSVRSQNAHQAIAVLRAKREVGIQPLELAMASRADLCQRVEKLRARGPVRPLVGLRPQLLCGLRNAQ
jgi:hypothetical protein